MSREQGAPKPIRHTLGTVTSAEGTRLSSSNRPDQAAKYGPGSGESVQVETPGRVSMANVVDAANEVLSLVQLLDSKHYDSGGWTAARALNRRRWALVTVRQELHTAAHDAQRRWALAGLQAEAENLRRDFGLTTTAERSPS